MTGELSEKGLVWKDEYSVGVVELDNQHKNLIGIISRLSEAVNRTSNEEEIRQIIADIIAYKKVHLATEEGYFHKFQYEGTAEHERRHHEFSERMEEFQKRQQENPTISIGFEIVDYLEDWFIQHLLRADKLYTECFHEHGLY